MVTATARVQSGWNWTCLVTGLGQQDADRRLQHASLGLFSYRQVAIQFACKALNVVENTSCGCLAASTAMCSCQLSCIRLVREYSPQRPLPDGLQSVQLTFSPWSMPYNTSTFEHPTVKYSLTVCFKRSTCCACIWPNNGLKKSLHWYDTRKGLTTWINVWFEYPHRALLYMLERQSSRHFSCLKRKQIVEKGIKDHSQGLQTMDGNILGPYTCCCAKYRARLNKF